MRNKIGQITMDNASSNDTMMVELETILVQEGIPFHRDGNRIRYLRLRTYADILAGNPVQKVRDLVSALRSSGQRRHDFEQFISEGIASQSWPDHPHIQPLQLLRDCETRWSSTFLMMDRTLLLYPAIEDFVKHPSRADLSKYLLMANDRAVLADIYQVLEVAHQAQQLVSSERTPTLALVLPAYELLVDSWKQLRIQLPPLAHLITLGVEKIEEYMMKSRMSRMYSLAMIVNPMFKLSWIQQHWSDQEAKAARSWALEAVCLLYAPLVNRMI
ncbi:hypothetical protein DICSQDRAFT_65365 [Dichomitus squalens LYAD-421 SS1]|uniref:Uncharacterized protein n=1 Tax=Dichomitus squalens (strain LYAD-421) TaxID=732165 RepID=R7SW88_DICSQ|nr:uncharacterized protein DICSQDRAFT_65365 [Dichomitus squalens LYAD-421 SS1]EJF59222.1 hypothetical protein DICSQDRAFT_65365 [Dichomitus squalens LYAD-421 SS1]